MTHERPSRFSRSPHDPAPAGAIRSADDVQRMFDRIVHRYDTMNRLMTGGRDVAWRKLVAETAVRGGREHVVLDVATGTGDLALALAQAGAQRVIGIDFSSEMIAAAARKVASRTNQTPERAIALAVADAMRLPFADNTFSACTVSFGLRNMPNYEAAIREMTRVLRPGGRWVCLELTPLRVPGLGAMFSLYFDRVVPLIGGVISGDRDAYRYLPASVQHFPDARSLQDLMAKAGLLNARYRLLGGGTVAMHVGEKSWVP